MWTSSTELSKGFIMVTRKIVNIYRVLFAMNFTLRKNKKQTPGILYSCLDVDRYASIHGKMFSPLLASIHEYYKINFIAINVTHSISFYPSCKILNGHISLNFHIIKISLYHKLISILKTHKKSVVIEEKKKEQLYEFIIKSNNIKIIFAIQPPHELCVAAHNLSVKVVEPLHGMNLSVNDTIFRNTLQRVCDNRLPNFYLAFDRQTFTTLNIFLDGRTPKIFQIPHPWHVECNKNFSTLIENKFESQQKFDGFDKIILLSLQWGYDGERDIFNGLLSNGVIHDAILEVIQKCPEFYWLIRLHPIQQKGNRYFRHRKLVYKLAQKFNNVEFDLATSLALPLLLNKVDGHITMSSGSAGEAAQLQVPSLMLCRTLREGGEMFGAFSNINNKDLISFQEPSPDNVCNWINQLGKRIDRFGYEYSEKQVQIVLSQLFV